MTTHRRMTVSDWLFLAVLLLVAYGAPIGLALAVMNGGIL